MLQELTDDYGQRLRRFSQAEELKRMVQEKLGCPDAVAAQCRDYCLSGDIESATEYALRWQAGKTS